MSVTIVEAAGLVDDSYFGPHFHRTTGICQKNLRGCS